MSEAMTDFRFEPRTPDAGRETGSVHEPLAEMAAQIRLLDQAAALAAIRVAEAAGGLHGEVLADLGSALVERVNEIHAECVRLSGMLDRATKLAGRGAAPTDTVPEVFRPAPRNGAPADEPVRESRPEPEPEPASAPQPDRRRAPGQATPEGVRLAATQMAVAGSSRSEIERVLRIQFGVRDADTALDEIFGTRSGEVR